jgi:hypothetical protein
LTATGPDATTKVSEAAETVARMATLSPPVHPSALRELNNNTQVKFVRATIQEGETTREIWRDVWEFENGTVLERDIDDKPLFQDPATDWWHEEELLAWNSVEDKLFFEPKEGESADELNSQQVRLRPLSQARISTRRRLLKTLPTMAVLGRTPILSANRSWKT